MLYAALDYASLPAAARRRVDRWVLVFSALWGAVHLDDTIPPTDCPATSASPGSDRWQPLWRKPLAAGIPDAAGLTRDPRPQVGTYAKMWTPDARARRAQTVVARVLQERPDGSRAVVSHHNKATKGRLVRALALQRKTPRTAEALADLIESLDVVAELQPGIPGQPVEARHRGRRPVTVSRGVVSR